MKDQKEKQETSKESTMGSLNWSKMLASELGDRMKDKDQILGEYKLKMKQELELSIKLRKKQAKQ